MIEKPSLKKPKPITQMKTIISKYIAWYGKCIRVMVAAYNINYKKITRK
jgi:hypothetical protein